MVCLIAILFGTNLIHMVLIKVAIYADLLYMIFIQAKFNYLLCIVQFFETGCNILKMFTYIINEHYQCL
jgi:hypothetical protein